MLNTDTFQGHGLVASDFLAICMFLGCMIFLSVLLKATSTFRDYAIGNAEIPGPMIFAGLAGTYIGPGYTIGFCSEGFANGFLFLFLGLFFSLQTVLVGVYVVPRLKTFSTSLTAGDIMGTVYGRSAQLCTGLMSFLICTSFVAILAKVAGQTLNSIFGLPVSVGIASITLLGVAFSFFGGLKSVIATEAFQFSIYATIVPLLLLIVASKSHHSWQSWDRVGWQTTAHAISAMHWPKILSLSVGFLLGETLIPPGVIRALSAPAANVARRSFVAAGLFSVIWFGVAIALGVLGRSIMPDAEAKGIFLSLAFLFMPHFLIGLTIVAILAIILSCQESVLNAGSVSVTRDVWEQVSKSVYSEKDQLLISRIAIVMIGLFANGLALMLPDSIIDGLMITYAIWGASILPSLLFAVMLHKSPRHAAMPSILAGISGLVIWHWLVPALHAPVVAKDPFGVPSLLVGIGVSLLVFAVTALMSPPRVLGS